MIIKFYYWQPQSWIKKRWKLFLPNNRTTEILEASYCLMDPMGHFQSLIMSKLYVILIKLITSNIDELGKGGAEIWASRWPGRYPWQLWEQQTTRYCHTDRASGDTYHLIYLPLPVKGREMREQKHTTSTNCTQDKPLACKTCNPCKTRYETYPTGHPVRLLASIGSTQTLAKYYI